jgi:hypothetical protein
MSSHPSPLHPLKCERTLFARSLPVLAAATLCLLGASSASSQYSTRELTNSTIFPASSQSDFGKPIATDGTYVAYSTGVALWSQTVAGSKPKHIFTVGEILPESDSKATLIYPEIVVTNGYVVFAATDGGGSETGLFGLYAMKADGSAPAQRVLDSTLVGTSSDWSSDLDPYAYSWTFQASQGVAVIALQGVLYSANLDGADVKTLWQTSPSGFTGCSTLGSYSQLFLANSAYLPATDGIHYAFAAGSTLDFEGLYQGPLTVDDSCNNLINTGVNGDIDSSQYVKILPGQPAKAGPFAFPNTFQGIQIDDGYVYFGASVNGGVSSTEAYTGYFKIPLKGGSAQAIVTNISHVPGITGAGGKYDEVNLMGFAVSNGRFVFMADDATPGYPGIASFYMVDDAKYLTLFSTGSSVSNQCVGALDAEYAAPGALNQVSLSPTGLLTFVGQILPATFPNQHGPCSYPPGDYIHDPVGYFVLDTTHPLIPSEPEVSLNIVAPITYGEKPSLKIQVKPAAGAANPKDLIPTGTVSVWYTNPEYFGAQQPHSPSATLNADGEATIPLGAQQIGTYTYVVTYGGDANFASSTSENLVFPLHVTAPTFKAAAGTYEKAQSVYISDTTPGAQIYYTTNGATPTTKSKLFNDVSIPVTKSTVFKAIAVATGDANSAVTTATYTILKPGIAPTFTPKGATYTSAQTVTIKDAEAGATIYYALHGATPTTKSTRYTGPIKISSSTVIKAIAVAPGYSPSPVAETTYTIQ